MTAFPAATTAITAIPDLPDRTRMRRQTGARVRSAMAEPVDAATVIGPAKLIKTLAEALGRTAWATAPHLRTAAGRRAHHDEIDEQLSAWGAECGAAEIVSLLWPAGIPVAEVLQPHRQGEIPQLGHRRFFEPVEHPVNPTARHSTVPGRYSAGPVRYHRTHAPLPGQDNHAVLAELGYSAAEITALERDKVVSGTPGVRSNPA